MVRPEDWSSVKLSDFRASSGAQQNGTEAVKRMLERKGESPDDFYLGPTKEMRDGTIEFPLYHETNFGEHLIAPGTLMGNSRIMVYDPTKNEITKELYWQ